MVLARSSVGTKYGRRESSVGAAGQQDRHRADGPSGRRRGAAAGQRDVCFFCVPENVSEHADGERRGHAPTPKTRLDVTLSMPPPRV